MGQCIVDCLKAEDERAGKLWLAPAAGRRQGGGSEGAGAKEAHS